MSAVKHPAAPRPAGKRASEGAGQGEHRRLRRGAAARALRRRPRLRLERRAAGAADRGVPRHPDPLGDEAHRRADRQGDQHARDRARRRGRGQRRRRRRHQTRDRGRQRAAVQRRHRRRAHAGAAAGARAQHPPGVRLADGGEVGALEILRRGAVREDARDHRLRADRPAGGGARARLSDARGRVRPVRQRRALPRAGGREGREQRGDLRAGRLHLDPPPQDR